HNIRYLFLGYELGGKPSNLDCYTNNQLDCQKTQSKKFFKDGIKEVMKINKEGFKIALMCAEQSPLCCHRKLLIGDYLHAENFDIRHIDKDGTILNELF
ncbi:DUF488 family protein, partial [Escherichia coli]|uniref:DUF488 family protein n=1 Tax=Escherichia coli TaxID=562 RepID=UPI001308A038